MGNGTIIALSFAGIILIPTAIVFLILFLNKKKRQKKIDTYTGRTEGVILKITSKGGDGPDLIHVHYRVNGVDYKIRESIKYKSDLIRKGKFPIGQHLTPVLGEIKVGSTVTIFL